MRNSKLIKLICLVLSLFIAISLLGACSKAKEETAENSSEPSSNDTDVFEDEDSEDEYYEDEDLEGEEDYESEDEENYDEYDDGYYDDDYYGDDYYGDDNYDDGYSSDNYDEPIYDENNNSGDNSIDNSVDNYGDDSYGDNSGDDYYSDDDYEDWEDDNGENVETLKVYNAEAPILDDYRGISSTVYHAFGHMLDDKTGRVYTDEMMELELSRLVDSGVRFCRTRYTTLWAWDNVEGGWNWDSDRQTYYWNYCRNLQERGISVVQSVGWHLGCHTHLINGSIDEHAYITKSENYPEDLYGGSGRSEVRANRRQ